MLACTLLYIYPLLSVHICRRDGTLTSLLHVHVTVCTITHNMRVPKPLPLSYPLSDGRHHGRGVSASSNVDSFQWSRRTGFGVPPPMKPQTDLESKPGQPMSLGIPTPKLFPRLLVDQRRIEH